MTPAVRRVAVLVVLACAPACGPTIVDESVVGTPDTPNTTLAPVDPGVATDVLLDEIETLMFDLDQRIIDENAPAETLARIDELWAVAQVRIGANEQRDVFNFGQAIELARTGVERRRPADASKGYKIIVDVIDDYLAG